MGANAAVMLFLAERLDLQTYGLLVITISGQLLISRVLLLGVDVGMIRLIATPDLRSREREVVTAGLVIIVCTSVALLVVSLLSVADTFAIWDPGLGRSVHRGGIDWDYVSRLRVRLSV